MMANDDQTLQNVLLALKVAEMVRETRPAPVPAEQMHLFYDKSGVQKEHARHYWAGNGRRLCDPNGITSWGASSQLDLRPCPCAACVFDRNEEEISG